VAPRAVAACITAAAPSPSLEIAAHVKTLLAACAFVAIALSSRPVDKLG